MVLMFPQGLSGWKHRHISEKNLNYKLSELEAHVAPSGQYTRFSVTCSDRHLQIVFAYPLPIGGERPACVMPT
ncbi:hypothetical protein M758_11G070600 [Ceratodon purpureus]|nr:hypothetical protein M758_11G070400 [Ceratodon purpureus]KAG0600917.1 hypothetical protein M758_11G070600 [Ceratodon purpureus]